MQLIALIYSMSISLKFVPEDSCRLLSRIFLRYMIVPLTECRNLWNLFAFRESVWATVRACLFYMVFGFSVLSGESMSTRISQSWVSCDEGLHWFPEDLQLFQILSLPPYHLVTVMIVRALMLQPLGLQAGIIYVEFTIYRLKANGWEIDLK